MVRDGFGGCTRSFSERSSETRRADRDPQSHNDRPSKSAGQTHRTLVAHPRHAGQKGQLLRGIGVVYVYIRAGERRKNGISHTLVYEVCQCSLVRDSKGISRGQGRRSRSPQNHRRSRTWRHAISRRHVCLLHGRKDSDQRSERHRRVSRRRGGNGNGAESKHRARQNGSPRRLFQPPVEKRRQWPHYRLALQMG